MIFWLDCRLHLWAKLRYVYKNDRRWNQVQVAFTVLVSSLIPDLKRSDGSSPQASCHLSLVSPVNRQLRRRVPLSVQIAQKLKNFLSHSPPLARFSFINTIRSDTLLLLNPETGYIKLSVHKFAWIKSGKFHNLLVNRGLWRYLFGEGWGEPWFFFVLSFKKV